MKIGLEFKTTLQRRSRLFFSLLIVAASSNGAYPIMPSSERFQKVVFVRHGVAKHNLPDSFTGKMPNLRDPALLDPSLVYQGKQQALHAGHILQEWWGSTQQGKEIQLVVTSVSTK